MSRIIDEQKAKQGRSGRQVLTILIVALVLVAIGWYFVEKYGEHIDPAAGGPVQTAPAQTTTAPATAPATTTTPTAPAAPAPATAPAQ